MIERISSSETFLILGLLLPLLGAALTIAWLWRRDIIRFHLWLHVERVCVNRGWPDSVAPAIAANAAAATKEL
jgi:hypothetical protein